MNIRKVVLAYSGGLDTSVCVRWLREQYGCDVVAFAADVGQGDDFAKVKQRALAAGAAKVFVEDLKVEFASDYILPALQANAVYEQKYPLATALSRPIIAEHLVDLARREKTTHVAHGCTGKGNDQVRFEVGIMTLAPEMTVLAPVRTWELASRQEEIAYAQRHRIPIEKKGPYSIDKNLWGVSIEAGELEDPDVPPPAEAFQVTADPAKSPAKGEGVTITFEGGVPVAVNGKRQPLVALIEAVGRIGARHGIGRFDLVENRRVGFKSREVYEAPAAAVLLAAHRELESLVLDRETAHFKDLVSQRYAELVYDGLWFSPLKEALDQFIRHTQRDVTGAVRLHLAKGHVTIAGRTSPASRYAKTLATYGGGTQFDQRLAEGFIKIWGLPYKKVVRKSESA